MADRPTGPSRSPGGCARACESLEQIGEGKGNALTGGFRAATGDIIVMLDADGSADPGEIPRFLEALEQGAQFAKGTRFAPGGGSQDITRLRRAGNAVLTRLVNLLFRTKYSDLSTGTMPFALNAYRTSMSTATDSRSRR